MRLDCSISSTKLRRAAALNSDYSIANTHTEPPSGTSGNSPGSIPFSVFCIPRESPPHPDTTAFAHALLAAEPTRLVWGSDWPHVKGEWSIPMPNDADLADLLQTWIPDANLRKQVLVDNAARLYGFD